MLLCEGFKASSCMFKYTHASQPACDVGWAGIIIPIITRTDAGKRNARHELI